MRAWAIFLFSLCLVGCASRETADKAIAQGGCSIECLACFGLDLRCFDEWNIDGVKDITDIDSFKGAIKP